MNSMKDAMWSILSKSDQTNFTVTNNDEVIGNVIGINVENKYIEVIKTTVDLVSGLYLSNSDNKFVITNIDKNNNNYRIYFSTGS